MPLQCKEALPPRTYKALPLHKINANAQKYCALVEQKNAEPNGPVSCHYANTYWVHRRDSRSMATPCPEHHDHMTLSLPGGQVNRHYTAVKNAYQSRHSGKTTGEMCPKKQQYSKGQPLQGSCSHRKHLCSERHWGQYLEEQHTIVQNKQPYTENGQDTQETRVNRKSAN